MSSSRDHEIGVCAFWRPALARTLASLEAQTAPGGPLTVLVAGDDDVPSPRRLAETFARTSRHDVDYTHASARNISIARNAILAATRERGLRFPAHIDDDEVAPPDRYRTHLSTLGNEKADAAAPIRGALRAGTIGEAVGPRRIAPNNGPATDLERQA